MQPLHRNHRGGSMSHHLTAIVVVDENWAIGAKGDLLFSLPTDMKHFRATTLGHCVVMGRKTLDSFPGGRPLPKRRNIVLTTSPTLPQDVDVVHSVEALLAAVGEEPAFVIGGGTVYEALLPYCEKAIVTRVSTKAQDPDTFFPNLDELPQWEVVSTGEMMVENDYQFAFVEYHPIKL